MVIAAKGQSSLEGPLSECRGISSDAEGPLYGCQWHLRNTGQPGFSGKGMTAGEDINVEGVWNDGISGAGINVAIASDGIDLSHEDLSANVRSGPNCSFSEKNGSEGNGPSDGPSLSGTRAAGVIAASGYNGSGARGVAPGANICSYRLSGDPGEADAMVRNNEITAVSVSDRGREDGVFLQSASAEWEEGVEEGIREGFYGKGVFYVRGAGDGHENNDQAGFNEHSNYHGVTAVCSTDGSGKKSLFSEEGVNLWVCAPGSDIVTTDNGGGYAAASGTFLSAAQAAGVAALLREINDQLSWRDIKLILAGSARQNDVSDPSWETGAVKYGSDVERYRYSNKYGFGVVDAEAATELAGNWKGVGEMRTVTASSDNELTIPDGEGEADGVPVSGLVIPDLEKITFTEFVEVELVFSCGCLQDLNIQITSPSGTMSELVRESARGPSNEEKNCVSYLRKKHRFGSAKHLGEDPSGEWTLGISDTASGDEEAEYTGTLHSWSIRVYGHGKGDTVSDFAKEAIPKVLAFTGTIPHKTYGNGSTVTLILPEATGGNTPYTYSLTDNDNSGQLSLHSGLDWNDDTRTISGTLRVRLIGPDGHIRRGYKYTATDADGDKGELIFSIRVERERMPDFGSETAEDQVYVNGRTVKLTLPEPTGGNGTLTYSLTGALPNGLGFDPAARVISGTIDVRPDILPRTWHYTYTARDDDGDEDSVTFSITVERNAPDFGGQTVEDQGFINGRAVTLTLPQATGGNGTLNYSITPALPNGLNFNSNTREITGTPDTLTSRRTYTYKVTDSDTDTDDADSDSLTFFITVETDSMPSFGNRSIPDQIYIEGTTAGLPVTLPEATSGNAPLTYRLRLTVLNRPFLPNGLDFDSNTRVISGTPATTTPATDYTYKVTDSNGDSDETMFSISVLADTEPSFGGGETIDDQEYIAVSQITPVTLPVATGGNPPLTYSIAPVLPTGLNFNANTRVLSGTPAAATSETEYTYRATDLDEDTAELTFSITTEEDSKPDFSGVTIPDQVYTGETIELPEAAGGNLPVTYSITPALSSIGLSFNGSTRSISGGTPTRASSAASYTYTATDRDEDTDEVSFRLSVEVPSAPSPPTGSPPGSGTDSGGGGCAVSDQSSIVPDMLGAVACLMLVPVSAVIRRKRRSQIKTWQ